MEQTYYEQDHLWRSERFLDDADEQKRFQAIADLIPQDCESLLDVGAGNGALLRYLEHRGHPKELTGLERARTAIEHSVCRSKIQQGEADSLPFSDRSQDVVTICEVLEHLPCGVFEQTLAELTRVARRQIIVTVPYREKRGFLACPTCGSEFPRYLHLRSFDDGKLSRLLPGFSLEKLTRIYRETQPSLPHPVNLYRWLRRKRSPMAAEENAVCPVCGYRNDGHAGESGASEGLREIWFNKLRSAYRRVLPKRQVPWWALAVYVRRT